MASTTDTAAAKRATLLRPLRLPCGAVVRNRLSKAATTECLADPAYNLPNERHARLYRATSAGGVGMIITGNMMVDGRFLEAPGNIVLDAAWHESEGTRRSALSDGLRAMATAAKGEDGTTLAIAQLGHPGRQCALSASHETVAPSPIRWKTPGLPAFAGNLLVLLPREMTELDINQAIARFASAARECQLAGWSGVEIHAAHGYLISQFLSPRANKRTDAWGGSPENRRKFLFEVVRAVQDATRAGAGDDTPFVIGVKINSADFQRGGFSEAESHEVIELLGKAGIDFIEVSGGTYEGAEMMKNLSTGKKSTAEREGFFLPFARAVHSRCAGVPLMVTGGFRTLDGMSGALGAGDADLLGLGRPICLEPDLPRRLFDGSATAARSYTLSVGVLDNLVVPILQNMWHQQQMALIARGHKTNPSLGYTYALTVGFVRTYIWEPRRSGWAKAIIKRGLEVPAKVATSIAVLLLMVALMSRRR